MSLNYSDKKGRKIYAHIGDKGKHKGDSSLKSRQSILRTGNVTK